MSGQSTNKPLLSDGSYNFLKKSATVLLPAAGALYFALAQIWGLPRAEEVVGSIAALNTFVGVFLGVSTRSYNKSDAKYVGEINVENLDDGGRKVFSLAFPGDPENLEHMSEATFKINRI